MTMPSLQEIRRQQQRALNKLARSQTVAAQKRQEDEYRKFLEQSGKIK